MLEYDGKEPKLGGFLSDKECGLSGLIYSSVDSVVPSPEVAAYGSEARYLPRTPPIVQWFLDCAAVSTTDAYLYELMVAGLIPEPSKLLHDPAYYVSFLPSRRKLYYDARAVSGRERLDLGVSTGAVWRAIQTQGVCAERWCTYQGDPTENPLADDDEAARHSFDQAGKIEMFECNDLEDIKRVIDAGHRVLHAQIVFDSMKRVGPNEQYVPSGASLGGHQYQIVGYEKGGDLLVIKNQWPLFGDDFQEARISADDAMKDRLGTWGFARVRRFSENER